jgi:D-glycero-D-manno-heptose 1,7-bisphosphate phosphatase
MRRAVFVDRDGVICRNRKDHVKSWEEFVFLPGALDALARLSSSELSVVVITNQAVINRHMVTVPVLEEIHARMVQAIRAAGGRVDRVAYCPHRPEEQCDCRQPRPGLLLGTAEELGLDLARSYLIGDAATDIQAGRAVGCRGYLVLTGRGLRQLIQCWLRREWGYRVVPNLGVAVNDILRRENGTGRRAFQQVGVREEEHADR